MTFVSSASIYLQISVEHDLIKQIKWLKIASRIQAKKSEYNILSIRLFFATKRNKSFVVTIAIVTTLLYTFSVEITWDDRKAAENLRKHSVDFDEAATVILNPLAVVATNNHPSGNRWEYLGHSVKRRVLYVVTVEKEGEESIRIISARKAEPHEKNKYEKGL